MSDGLTAKDLAIPAHELFRRPGDEDWPIYPFVETRVLSERSTGKDAITLEVRTNVIVLEDRGDLTDVYRVVCTKKYFCENLYTEPTYFALEIAKNVAMAFAEFSLTDKKYKIPFNDGIKDWKGDPINQKLLSYRNSFINAPFGAQDGDETIRFSVKGFIPERLSFLVNSEIGTFELHYRHPFFARLGIFP